MSSDAEARLRERLSKLAAMKLLRGSKLSGELQGLQDRSNGSRTEPSAEEIWHSVELARHQERPYTLDYVERMFDDFFELHGDRGRADDPALVTGLGGLAGRTVVLVGHQKGATSRSDQAQLRDGVPGGLPQGDAGDGARRAARLPAGHDDRHARRVPGRRRGAARPGRRDRPLAGDDGAPERADGGLRDRRGRSGGAVAIAVADRVLMQENAIYSVISPEGCAAILWRDAGEAQKAAAAFKPDAVHCLELGVVDAVVPEPEGGAHTDSTPLPRCSRRHPRSVVGDGGHRPEIERRRHRRASTALWACSRRLVPGQPGTERDSGDATEFRFPQIPQGYPPVGETRLSRENSPNAARW